MTATRTRATKIAVGVVVPCSNVTWNQRIRSAIFELETTAMMSLSKFATSESVNCRPASELSDSGSKGCTEAHRHDLPSINVSRRPDPTVLLPRIGGCEKLYD